MIIYKGSKIYWVRPPPRPPLKKTISPRPYRKLTREEIREIFAKWQTGEYSYGSLAAEYEVERTTVYYICCRKINKKITADL